jgi:hypothetical protein
MPHRSRSIKTKLVNKKKKTLKFLVTIIEQKSRPAANAPYVPHAVLVMYLVLL